MTHDHLTDLGKAVIKTRWLKELRTKLGISRRQLAEIMGVSTQTLRRWEEGASTNLWSISSRRIGEFYGKAIVQLEKVHQMGDDFNAYVPATVVASFTAQPTFVVEKLCEKGEMECLNLGVLGIYVKPHRGLSNDVSK